MPGSVIAPRTRVLPRRSWIRRTVRWVVRRTRYIIVLGALSLATVLLLTVAYYSNGYWRDLDVNVAASIIIVIATYLIFNPLIEGVRAASTREHPRLDLDDFIEHIANASKEVDILDTWTRLLDSHLRDRSFTAVREALKNRVNIRILLLDPESKAAEMRTEEIGHRADVPRAIMETLLQLYRLRQELSSNMAEHFEVRIYSASPSVQLYRWDDRALLSFFPIGKGAHETPKLETHMLTPWGQSVQARFDELWNDDRTITLEQYMRMPLEVIAGENAREQVRVSFVWLEGICYISDTSLMRHIAKHGIQNLEARAEIPNGEDGTLHPPEYQLAMVDEQHDSSRLVMERFVSKYGREHDFIVSLVVSTRTTRV